METDTVPEWATPYTARTFYDCSQIIGNKADRIKMNEESTHSQTPSFVYQNYSGKGGLHDIDFKSCSSFHDFTKAKQEFELGQFFTPAPIAKLMVELLEVEPEKKVADLCCGSGQFFNFLKENELSGIEIDKTAYKAASLLYPNAKIQNNDIRYMKWISDQDYILGNPPFNLLWEDEYNPLRSAQDKLLSQDFYVYQCHQYLKEGGFLCFVCPETWLHSELHHGKINSFLAEKFHKVFELTLPESAFKKYGVNNFPTKILCFQKKVPGKDLPYSSFTLEYENALSTWRDSEAYQQFQKNKETAHVFQAQQKFHSYLSQRVREDQAREPEDQYKKLLYELQRTAPHQVEDILKAREEVDNAECPCNMEWEEWERQRPTLEKLIKRLKKMKSAKPEVNLVRLIKRKSSILLKGYSRMAKRALSQAGLDTQWDIHKLINQTYWKSEYCSLRETLQRLYEAPLYFTTKKKSIRIPFVNFSAIAFLRKKHRKFTNQRKDISKITPQKEIVEKLKTLQLGDKRLLPHQVEDIAKALSKPSALLNWQMGTGKTLSSIAWGILRGGNTLVVAPSILIRKTWKEELTEAGETSFQIIESFADIEKSKIAKFTLISLERLPKYYKRLKRQCQFQNLILDESDNIKNKASTRAKALKAIARNIKFKIILTGTFTRNNAVEAYNQLELLFNNATSFLCEVPEITEYDRKEKEFVNEANPIFQLPYPAHGGHSIFRKNFSPRKTTVFGASKTNQELYNKNELNQILKSVRLRRRFDEVKPDGVSYSIKQITVPMTPSEITVYQYLFNEFVEMIQKSYEKEHDSRVSKILVIMRQIMALLQGVSHPWTFAVYDGDEITSKMQKVKDIIRENPGKKIMFGSPWKETAKKYAEVLERDHKVISLSSELSITKRNDLIEEFREGDAQVLVSTLGVLKAGVNIPEVEIVITDSYPWNFAQLSQYFFRAIRLNAKNHTQVYCLSNEGSFDTNVFNLLIAKERVNTFIQDGEEVNNIDIAGDFGVNEDMMASAIQMVKEKVNGNVRSTVTWGNSIVSDGKACVEE